MAQTLPNLRLPIFKTNMAKLGITKNKLFPQPMPSQVSKINMAKQRKINNENLQ